MKNILVVGSMNMDLVMQTDQFPKPGETRAGFGFSAVPGGKGANQAAAAAKLGCPTYMLGGVGNDAYGEILKEHLSACGVKTDRIWKEDGSSGVAVITVCGGENEILLDAGANGRVTPERLSACSDLFAWADRVVLQFEIPMDAVIRGAEMAKAAGAEVVLNPAPFREIPVSLLKNTDWLVLNETEAAEMGKLPVTQLEEAAACMEKIEEQFSGRVFLTLGKEGCLYREDGMLRRMHAFPVRAVDTTAAGDCFIGGLCAAMDGERPLSAAVQYAAAASAVTVSRMGAGSSLPSREEVDEFLKKNKG